MLDLILICKL